MFPTLAEAEFHQWYALPDRLSAGADAFSIGSLLLKRLWRPKKVIAAYRSFVVKLKSYGW